jgi:hypothetical protein
MEPGHCRLSKPATQIKTGQYPLDEREQTRNNVPVLFWRVVMVRAVVAEAVALTSLALFLGMIAVWAQVIASL